MKPKQGERKKYKDRTKEGLQKKNSAGCMDVFVLQVKTKCRTIKTKKQLRMEYQQSAREHKKNIPPGTVILFFFFL